MMAEPEVSEYASEESPMFEKAMQQGSYSLTIKRRGDAVFIESLRCDGKGNPKDLYRLTKRLLKWQSITGLTLTIIVESHNKKMLRFMERWKSARTAARVYTLN